MGNFWLVVVEKREGEEDRIYPLELERGEFRKGIINSCSCVPSDSS